MVQLLILNIVTFSLCVIIIIRQKTTIIRLRNKLCFTLDKVTEVSADAIKHIKELKEQNDNLKIVVESQEKIIKELKSNE